MASKVNPPVNLDRATARNNLKVLLAQARVARGLVIRDAPKVVIVKRLDAVIDAIEHRVKRSVKRK